jgi:hypothetical protein
MIRKLMVLPLALAAAAAFSASPADAQGRGKGNDKNPHVERRDRDRDDDDRRFDDRRSRTSSRSSSRFERRVPPGWCIGRGNPHNTVANCGPGSNRYDRRYDPYYGSSRGSTGTYGSYGNTGSYSEWKRWHDQQCRDLARQRPLDLRWQAQVRSQCSAEDRQARASYGV